MIPSPRDTPSSDPGGTDKFDDDQYPAYTMGRAAEMLGTSQNFLRSLDETGLIEPQRSAGGHRRYSRGQLRLAARVRELVDQGTAVDAACRIVSLEDQLRESQRQNTELRSAE
ncbi:MerR family transcriptional regulator [Amycolatopsis rubida]|uniref:DNA-binding transcriptional regulator, MerR family n=1 Tax=Amycolatopsis rubida TaxID=112413 RepID=A0A1I5EUX9_9PSEU|nr:MULTISPECIES: MerR family transcriptional regulator [Amycolatopsis]MYW94509.1 MerR family transcriptional regulator [Amycolatopsis rubida]NEC59497.1 MerR family transcriptional regulator [Amycolatopsis rubida]OAP27220.1 putative heat shock protein HspR [Amycolatopsis sp. M39]SFO15342.1 DNA-binding transcriptional regulator, MerR family [Amycolatopsis rubida]